MRLPRKSDKPVPPELTGDPRRAKLVQLKERGLNSAQAAAKTGMDLKDVNKLWPMLGYEEK